MTEEQKEQDEEYIEEHDDEVVEWEEIPLDPFDAEFLKPMGDEIQQAQQQIGDLSQQLEDVKSRLNQLVGEINAKQQVINRYVKRLDEKYGIPDHIDYVFDFQNLRLVRKDLADRAQKKEELKEELQAKRQRKPKKGKKGRKK